MDVIEEKLDQVLSSIKYGSYMIRFCLAHALIISDAAVPTHSLRRWVLLLARLDLHKLRRPNQKHYKIFNRSHFIVLECKCNRSLRVTRCQANV